VRRLLTTVLPTLVFVPVMKATRDFIAPHENPKWVQVTPEVRNATLFVTSGCRPSCEDQNARDRIGRNFLKISLAQTCMGA
jgi:hypothetical protein